MSEVTYGGAGVRKQTYALAAVARRLGPTLDLGGARVLAGFGSYAAVLALTDDLALAICTDGVGTKTMVASALDRYDTIGFDCVAMNCNDLVCVGARPVAMVDYLAVNTLDEARTDALLEGLGAAAKRAGVSVPGGELAQLPEIVGSDGTGPGDERAFDLVGTSVGTLHPAALIDGSRIVPGDALVGIRSSGVHSNGLTLARRVLLGRAGLRLGDPVPELGRTLGEELLEPTLIYVPAVLALWDAGIDTRGLAHITGDGLGNLCRLSESVGFSIDSPPEPHAVFDLIQATGGLTDSEMYAVFNMGVGMVVVTPDEQAEDAAARIAELGFAAGRIGRVSADAGRLEIPPAGLAARADGGVARLAPA